MLWSLPCKRKKGQKIFFVEETKTGKVGNYLEKGNIYCGEKKNGEERGWKYLETNLFCGGEEREKNIWRRKISFLWMRGKTEKEKEEYIWRIYILQSKFVWVKNVVLSILLCH